MRKEYAGHTLSATALTHEAWFRLAEQTRTQWQSRSHFIGVAAIMMRRILVNHAVAKQAAKREAMLVSLDLTEVGQLGQDVDGNVLQVHEALLAFEAIDPRAAKVVELKFFGGLEIEEIAELLDPVEATALRRRVQHLLREGTLPVDRTGMRFPWPLVSRMAPASISAV